MSWQKGLALESYSRSSRVPPPLPLRFVLFEEFLRLTSVRTCREQDGEYYRDWAEHGTVAGLIDAHLHQQVFQCLTFVIDKSWSGKGDV